MDVLAGRLLVERSLLDGDEINVGVQLAGPVPIAVEADRLAEDGDPQLAAVAEPDTDLAPLVFQVVTGAVVVPSLADDGLVYHCDSSSSSAPARTACA